MPPCAKPFVPGLITIAASPASMAAMRRPFPTYDIKALLFPELVRVSGLSAHPAATKSAQPPLSVHLQKMLLCWADLRNLAIGRRPPGAHNGAKNAFLSIPRRTWHEKTICRQAFCLHMALLCAAFRSDLRSGRGCGEPSGASCAGAPCLLRSPGRGPRLVRVRRYA